MKLEIQVLQKSHDRKAFNCGEPELDNYLQKIARQHVNKGIAKTFVLIDSKTPQSILGYMSLSACEILADEIPHHWKKKYPHKLPAMKLARLAVDINQQKKGYGQLLMVDALHKALNVAKNLGIVGLFVDAKHRKAKTFYKQYGFLALPEQLDNLFLPIKAINELINSV